jgi:MHS family proline/betaine transporter-like MFS transporter
MVASAIATKRFTGRRSKALAIAAGISGNILEWYDFGVYIYLAPTIAKLFFSNSANADSLLLSLAVFGSGFLMRPLGAILFAVYGDKVGRRAALSIVMVLMGVATCTIGLLPTANSGGITMTLVLVALRLLQGLAAGGEWGGSASFIVEYSFEGRRGFYGAWHVAGVVAGLLLGSGVSAAVNGLLPGEAVLAWGWRVPFLLGIVVAILGLTVRWIIAETPKYTEIKARGEVTTAPLAEVFRTSKKEMFALFGLAVHQSLITWVTLSYMPTYFVSVARLQLASSLTIVTIGLAFLVVLLPIFGALSDRVGRRPLLFASTIGAAVFSIPFFLLAQSGSYSNALAAQLGLMMLNACMGGIVATYVELFPTKVRYTGVSVAYNFAQTIFGGFAPFFAQFLLNVTGHTIAPAYLIIAGTCAGTIALLNIKETAFEPLR